MQSNKIRIHTRRHIKYGRVKEEGKRTESASRRQKKHRDTVLSRVISLCSSMRRMHKGMSKSDQIITGNLRNKNTTRTLAEMENRIILYRDKKAVPQAISKAAAIYVKR